MGFDYLAILVASVAAFLFGWLWYGPLFGKQWMRLAQVRAKEIKFEAGPMLIAFVSTIVLVSVFSIILGLTGRSGWVNGVGLGLLFWLGFSATASLGMVLWEKKSWKLWLLNNAYAIIEFALVGAILGAM